MSAATAENYSAIDPVLMKMRGVTKRRPPCRCCGKASYSTANLARHRYVEFGISQAFLFVVRS